MRYLDKLEEARKKLNYKDETDRAIAADKKLKTARGNFRTAKPGSKDQTSALTRQERALKVKQGRLKRAADKMDFIKSHTSYQQVGDILAEVVSKAVLSSDETVKRRLDRRRAVVTGRMNKARKDSLDPRGTNSRRGVGSENKEMDDQINTADVTRSKSYKKKFPKGN